MDLSAAYHAWHGFAPVSGLARPSGDNGREDDKDLDDAERARAIALAEKSGLPAYRVDAAPDGTISIVVIDPE